MSLSTGLFHSIQGFIKLANFVGTNTIITRRERHVYFLIEIFMKEGIIDIKLLKVQYLIATRDIKTPIVEILASRENVSK